MVQTLGCGPTVGSLWSSSAPPSLGRGRVVPPPPRSKTELSPHLFHTIAPQRHAEEAGKGTISQKGTMDFPYSHKVANLVKYTARKVGSGNPITTQVATAAAEYPLAKLHLR